MTGRRALGLVALSLMLAGPSLAQKGRLQVLEIDGRPAECHYAAEPLLRVALDQMSDYYLRLDGQCFRVWEDLMLPSDLRDLDFKPAVPVMRQWAREFFAAQDPTTGLVPLGGPRRAAERLYTIPDQSQCMFLPTMGKVTPLLAWFPDDPEFKAQCVKMTEGFLKHMRFGRLERFGLFDGVRVDTGYPEGGLCNVTNYGSAVVGLVRIGKATGHPEYLEAAKGVTRFVSEFAVKYCAGIVPEKFYACGGFPSDLSSDGLYFLRALGWAYDATGDSFYKDIIIRHGQVYFDAAWQEAHGHYATTIDLEAGKLTPVGTTRGDTKYNYPHLMCLLTRLTGDRRYMQRFDRLWDTYTRLAVDGWVPDVMEKGAVVRTEGRVPEDRNQSIYLTILLDAYETTRDPKYLRLADQWVQKLLTPAGRAHWRADGLSHYFLDVLRLKGPLARLEMDLGQPGKTVVVSDQQGTVLRSETVPAPVAVFYLAPGPVRVAVQGGGAVSVELAPAQHKVVQVR